MVTAKAERARVADRILGFFGLRLVVFLIAAKAFLPGVLLAPPNTTAFYHDEHNVLMHEETARRSIVEHHQLPAWNPYFCGGIVELSNAPSNVLAPDFLLRVAYGTLAGRRLAVLLFVLLGMEGVFRYARHAGAGAIGSVMGGVAFACSGHFVQLLSWGWVFMFHYALVPWIALSFEKGLRSRWWIVAGGFFCAWLVLGGGTYVAPYTAVALVFLAALETWRAIARRDGDASVKWYRPLLTLAAMGVVAGLLSAVRLLPLLELLAGHSRLVDQKDRVGPFAVASMLVATKLDGAWAARMAGDFYVGARVVLFAVAAAALADKRAGRFWALAVLYAAFAAGEFKEEAPYEYMRKVPLFSQLRFPERMTTMVALFLSLAAAVGVTRIEDLGRDLLEWIYRAVRRVVAWVLEPLREDEKKKAPVAAKEEAPVAAQEEAPAPAPAAAKEDAPAAKPVPLVVKLVASGAASYYVAKAAHKAAMDVVETNTVREGALYVMKAPARYLGEFKQARGNRWDAHVWPMANRGSLHCFEEHKLFMSPYLRGDLAAEEYGAPETDTKVERVSWSPHEIVLKVRSSGPGRFLVNQNHADAWTSSVGEVGSDGGLLSVRVPPGEHVVRLVYSDWRVRVGAVITLATVAVIVHFGARRLYRRGRAVYRLYRTLPR